MKKILLFIYGLFSILWTQAQSPGGVSTNLVGWYSADVSASATTWTDRSPAGNNLTGAGTPTFTNLLNFNRVATFNGSNQRFSIATTSASWPGTNTANTYYYVATPTGTNTSRSVFGKGTGANATNGMHSGKGSTATTLVSGATGGGTVSKTSVWAQNTSNIIRTGFNGGATGAHYISDNSAAETSAGSNNPNYASNSAFAIGSQNTATGFWDGNIAEVIAYSGKHTSTDFNRVESYLAMKYGITKANDYVNSAGTTIWTSGGGYDNNIAGIGRDDMGGAANSGLNQKQSQSQNSGIQPVIGNVNITDTNANNTNNFGTDLSALVWGSDTGNTSFATSFAFGGLNNRMARIWRVQETGTVGNVKVAIPVSQLSGSINQLNLVVSSDATFNGSDSRTAMTLETLGGVQYYTVTVDFTSGQFFTFAAFATSPGGVLGTTSWFRSDADVTLNGSTVSAWRNQSLNTNLTQLSQVTATRQPAYSNTGWNFNPSITYDGSSDILENTMPSILNILNATNNEVFGALSITGGSASRVYFQISDNGSTNPRLSLENTTAQFPTSANNISNTALSQTSSLPSIINFSSGSGNLSYAINGSTPATGTFSGSIGTGPLPRYMLGGFNASGSYSNFISGNINEVVTFDKTLTTTERQRVQSYLALKYGQTLAHNYLNSSGTVTWDITTNIGYNNNIAGIARDDASALNQKQSQSVNSGLQPVIGNVNITDTNANNNNNFTADLSALVWGSDTGSTGFSTSFAFGGLTSRMTRIWRVQETGTLGTVKVAIPVSQITGSFTQLNLVVSADATFDGSDSRTAMTLETLGGVQYYTATVDFTSGQFFSFAAFVAAPGGVVNGLTLWMNPDLGIDNTANISTWTDQVNGVVIPRKNTSTTLSINTALNFNRVVNMPTTNFNGFELPASDSNISRYDPSAVDGMSVFGAGIQSASWNNYGALISKTDGGAWDNGWVMSTTNISGSNWGLLYVWGNESGTGVGNSAVTSSGSLIRGNAFVASGWWDPALTNKNNVDLDAAFSGSINVTTTNSVGSPLGIGYAQGDAFGGQLGDQIYYNRSLNSTERARVQSYLSVKFGTTLGTNALPFNYLNSAGNTIWTGSVTYQNNIAGIARDDASGLNQKQSQSSLSGLQPVIGNVNITDTNANNTNTFSTDLSALIWGSDTGSTSFTTSFVFGGLTTRMARIWRVQETGTVGTVKVALPVTQVQGNATQLNLVVSSDATFDGSDTRTAMTLETLGGVQYYTATVDFTSGQFFTFAGLATAPGGVFANLRIWLKADDGFTPSSWADRSGSSNNFTQTNASRQPNLIAANTKYNFNPTVNFGTTGADARFMVVPSGRPFTANGLDGTFLLTINQNSNSGFRDYLGFGNTTTGSALINANDPVFTANNSGNRTFRIFPYSGASSPTNLQLTTGITYISDVTWRVGVSGGITYGLNGFNGSNGDTFTAGNSLGFNGGVLGAQPEDSDAFMSEVIAYERALNATEMQRVRSYLSIKYGTTLNQNTAQNYLASDGTTIFWDATTNAVYKNNIAGIARDDTSSLNQKQSQSINSGIQVIIGNGSIAATNAANTSNFSADKSALVWGDNGLPLTYITSISNNIPSGLNFAYRMSRIWRVQETGTVGTTKVAMRSAAVAYGENAYIIVSSDPTFASGNTWYPLTTTTTINGVTHYTADIDFTNGQYFTFAAKVIGPGGVPGASLWNRADMAGTYADNAAVNNWDDVSLNENDGVQNTTANQPLYKNNTTDNINFNPVVNFNGSSHYLQLNSSLLPTGTTARTVVGATQSTISQGYIIGWGFGQSAALRYYGAQSSSVRLDHGNGSGQSSGSPFTTLPNISGYTFAGSGGASSLYQDNRLYNTANIALNTDAGTIAAIGANVWNGSYNAAFSGKLPELAVYPRALTSTELLRVNTYLAIKYGITLDQATATNYLASDASIIWNATTNIGYNNNIAGIARDDASGLKQKQSQSVNTGTQVVIGNGSIAATNAANYQQLQCRFICIGLGR
ncbi:hypothetical protein QF023_003623 [Chryseobacterium sp. SLBN-27]|uniref:beta strand repeat-containing protein n=1 Tax=Chryseobacterium sp. SLBN-27 TaxID=3042287 RepID=UPI0028583D90|nr:hypothetical protein [Chryseobacterium sp. SLBN-27]MDR6160107.1 hypothetical protein [Chryseobacterium sp. SLBN-27]